MKVNLLAALCAAALPLLLCSCATSDRMLRTEITKATTPQDDQKPNSDAVPEVYAVSSGIQRVVVLRFKFQTDLLAGLEKAVKAEKIKNAVILSGIGSVRNFHLHSVSNRDFPSKNIFVKAPAKPADIVSVNGYVINGRVHAHLTLADDRRAYGGHLEPETSVFTFAILTLGIVDDDAAFDRLDDKTYR